MNKLPSLSVRAVFCICPLLLGQVVTLAATNVAAADDEKWNFVVIMADDLGYGDIGCYGNERIKTPQLDALAAGGMRFTDFHSNGPVCSPTRAALVTGRYQQRTGIVHILTSESRGPAHYHGLQDCEETFGEAIAAAGYQTALFGKWHAGYCDQHNPIRHGFQQFRGFVSGNIDFFSHVNRAGKLDWWHNDKIEDEAGYTTHLITKHALKFIDDNKSRPFCIYLPHEAPHAPYQGPGDAPIRKVGDARRPYELALRKQGIDRQYKEMVEEMDKGIGQIVERLKEHQIAHKTLVLFFSDNGAPSSGNNGKLRGHKGRLWEGGHRVPCIAYCPGKIKAGSVSHELAITLDIMPTLLDAAGVDLSENDRLDGVSLLPLLTKGEALERRELFWSYNRSQAMRDGEWKFIVGARDQRGASLYNLKEDLSEKNNLADQEPERLKKMMAAVKAWELEVATGATKQPTSIPDPPRDSLDPKVRNTP